MIKKLRVKFVITNMAIVTLMLCVILSMVYQFTKANLEDENLSMMRSIAAQPFRMGSPIRPGKDVRLPYFVLKVSPNGEVIASNGGFYDLTDDEVLRELVQPILTSQKDIGVIKEYKLRYYREYMPLSQKIVFTDISSELATLRGLLRNCILIGEAGFLVFLGISILLARWAVHPVDTAWKQQRQFVADASHELKTPLTVIMTNAELLQSPEFDEESRRRFTENISVTSHQMRELVEKLLMLAKTENAQKQLVFSPVDFSKLVSDAILPFEAVFFERGLSLTSQVDVPIKVGGDQAQLRQVVDVLLDNAQKYSTQGGATQVVLKRSRKNRCLLTVSNQGEAISPEDLKHIFKRFYRADKARSRTGSFGIGLSIAHSVVTRHKGKIWAESKDGVNAFYVELKCI